MNFATSYRRFAMLALKMGVGLVLAYMIYERLVQTPLHDGSSSLWENLWSVERSWALFMVVGLVFVNWGIEAIKWQALFESIAPLSLRQAYRAVMVGNLLGIVTPSRLGEYGGKMLCAPPHLAAESVKQNFVASLSQNIVTLGFGLLGSLYFGISLGLFPVVYLSSLTVFGLALLALALFWYFNIDHFFDFIKQHIPFKKIKNWVIKIDAETSQIHEASLLHKILAWSALRYVVYTLQYLLMLYYFDFQGHILLHLGAVLFIFLIQTGLPLPPMLGFLARTEIAVMVWSLMQYNAVTVTLMVTSLWVINLALPAIFGLIILFNIESASDAQEANNPKLV